TFEVNRVKPVEATTPDRRRFLQAAVLTSAAAAVPALAAARAYDPAPAPPQQRVPSFEFDEATITDLQSGMSSGKFSSRTLTGKYRELIQPIDMAGPNVNAVIELNPDALTIAAALDRERADGKVRSPMHGIPVLIKDNIDTADKMLTTAGSLAMVGAAPAQ